MGAVNDGPANLEAITLNWKTRRVLAFVIVTFAVAALIAVILMIGQLRESDRRFAEEGIHTTAEITRIVVNDGRHTAHVQYEVNGLRLGDKIGGDDIGSKSVGDLVAIVIDPENLGSIRRPGEKSSYWGAIVLLLGAAALTVGSLYYLYRVHRARRILDRAQWERGYLDAHRTDKGIKATLADHQGDHVMTGKNHADANPWVLAASRYLEEPTWYAIDGRWVLMVPDGEHGSVLFRSRRPKPKPKRF